ncbi:class I SAM-dependent methyltransferase [Candidatus Omnitrophota bacterium]
MYDFYFGTEKEINNDPKKYLLAIKRMLPRWCNSIPDSEYLALYDTISSLDLPTNPVFVETGSGASSIVLNYFALKTGGQLYTWDICGPKLFYLRSVLNDTLARHFIDKNLCNHWKHIAFSSISEFAGTGILRELNKRVSVAFFDSEHTLDVLMKEINNVCEVLNDVAVIAIDDGNYAYKSYNTAYINMIRKKLNLSAIKDSSDNLCRPFWQEVEDYLQGKFKKVTHLDDTYKKTYQSDIFWSYYKLDRDAISGFSMEKTDMLDHRFDTWKIYR